MRMGDTGPKNLYFLVFQTEGFMFRKECERQLEEKVKFAEEKPTLHERQIKIPRLIII